MEQPAHPPKTSTTSSAAAPRRRAPRRHFDWEQAAKLIAGGTTPAQVAARLGCEEARVWRQIETSARFQGWVMREVERRRLLAGLRLADLQPDGAADSGN